MLDVKDELLKDLLVLSRRARVGDVDRAVTAKFNRIIGRAYDELKLDMRGLLIQPSEHRIQPQGRHTDEGPLRPEEADQALMNRSDFQAKLEEAIALLDAHE